MEQLSKYMMFVRFCLLSFLLSAAFLSIGQNVVSTQNKYILEIDSLLKKEDFRTLYFYTRKIQESHDYQSKTETKLIKYNVFFLSLYKVNNGQLNDASQILDSLLQELEKENNDKYKYLLKGVNGIVKYRQGEFITSLEYLSESVQYLSAFPNRNKFDNYFQALFLRYLGRAYSETGVYLQAISTLQKSNQIFEELTYIENTYINYKFIGRVYLLSSRKNDSLDVFALENYLYALQGFKRFNIKTEIPWIYTIIADYYLEKNQADQAKLYQDSAYMLLNKKDDILLLGLSQNNFGKISEINGDIKNAKKYYIEAINNYREIKNCSNRATSFYNLSFILLKEKQLIKAADYADSSLLFSIKAQNSDKIARAYLLISDIYKAKADYKNAYNYFLKSHKLSDKLLQKQSVEIANSYKILYKTEQKESEILLLKHEGELKDLKVSKYKNYVVLFVVVLMFSFSVYLIRRKRTKKINAIRFKLKGQEDEKQRLSRELHDGIGSSLKGIAIKINHLAEKNDLEKNAVEIVKNITDVNDELRRISHDLALPFQSSLDKNIRKFVERVKTHNSLSIFYNSFPSDGWELTDYNVSNELYRIIQEAINNILEHSDSDKAEIQLTRSKNKILLTISDDGKGFDQNHTENSGIGILNIQSRVKVINGKISIASEPDGGTFIEISVPY